MSVRSFARSLVLPLRRLRGRATLSHGQLGSSEPLCRDFGYSRGTPVDRYYIEGFLAAHAADIRGRVLEIGDSTYSRRFGGNRIDKQDILHVRPTHRGATITGDLTDPGLLPRQTFDCVILTQTLHLIFDMRAAVDNLQRALRPGGVLLVTVPGISPVDTVVWKESWYWSLTGEGLRRLLTGAFDAERLAVSSYGNLLAATAFLHGAAVEEIGSERLDPSDAAYPVTVAARAIA